jgi:hypothetical protein
LAHPRGGGLRLAVRQEIDYVPGLQIDENRAEPTPTQKSKIVSAKKEDRFGGEIRQIHDTAQDCLTRRSYSQAGSESGTPFATRCQSNGGDLLRVADRHSGERLGKVWEPRGFDFPRTVPLSAGEFANGEEKLDLAAYTRSITQDPA